MTLAVVAVAPALLVAACDRPLAMQIVNRTQVPLAVIAGKSTISVEACGERTVLLEGGTWGGDNAGRPLVEQAPPGAYLLTLPGGVVTPPIEGGDDRRVVVTRDYVGYGYGPYTYPIVGIGTFPPDANAVACAGSPPPLPSPSPSTGQGEPRRPTLCAAYDQRGNSFHPSWTLDRAERRSSGLRGGSTGPSG